MKAVIVVLAAMLAVTNAADAQGASAPISLNTAIAEAMDRNAEVAAAVKQVDVARAQRAQVALAPLQLQPVLSFTPDVPGGVGTLQTAAASIAQQFSPSGNLSAARSQADFTVAAAGFGAGASRRDISLRTASAYYALAGAQAAVDVARQNVASSQEFVRSAQLRARAGAVGNFEVLRATIELRRVQTELLRSQAAANTSRVALNTLLGRAPATTTTVVEPTDAAPGLALPVDKSPASHPPSPAPLSSHAGTVSPTPVATAFTTPTSSAFIGALDPSSVDSLAERATQSDPVLQQILAQISAQTARARASAALRRPALTLGAGYQISRATRSREVFGSPVLTGGIAIPLLDRGTISGAVREAEATRTVLEAQAQGRTRELQAEVTTATADIYSAQTRAQFAATSRKQAEDGLRIAQYGFRQGALGSLDVLNAKNAAASARGDERQAVDDLAAARVRLRILLGVPTSS